MSYQAIERKRCTKLFRLHIDELVLWDDHIQHITSKVSNGLRMLYKIRNLTNDINTLNSVYNSLVLPYFDYCGIVWGSCSKIRMDRMQKLQNRAARIITRADYSVRSYELLNELGWQNLNERHQLQLLTMMFKVFHKQAPNYLQSLFQSTSEVHSYDLRGSKFDFQLPKPKTNFMKRSFSYRGAIAWNELPNGVRELNTLESFKRALQQKR